MAAAGVLKLKRNNAPDDFQTPFWPVKSLIDALPEPIDGVVWEPACGKNNIVTYLQNMQIRCFGTDILSGQDFLKWIPDELESDYIITNPPFSLKDKFIEKCYYYGKPFALLLPLTALEGKKRQRMYKEHGMQALILPKRVDFEFPDGTYKGRPHFSCCWITNGFNFPSDLTFL